MCSEVEEGEITFLCITFALWRLQKLCFFIELIKLRRLHGQQQKAQAHLHTLTTELTPWHMNSCVSLSTSGHIFECKYYPLFGYVRK